MRRERADPVPTHDLARLRRPIALAADAPGRSGVAPALRRTPWVVVWRGQVGHGQLPVMVRGTARHPRVAGLAQVAAIAERLSPGDLVDRRRDIARRRRDAVPALARVAQVPVSRITLGSAGMATAAKRPLGTLAASGA